MSKRIRTIGAFEAKTKFSRLLSCLAKTGAEFVITKQDRPVARLVPAVKPHSHDEAAKTVTDWSRLFLHVIGVAASNHPRAPSPNFSN
jgi:antitoxin (DNA-binding transcriptional repressor) of toxin-antitoxin stability system